MGSIDGKVVKGRIRSALIIIIYGNDGIERIRKTSEIEGIIRKWW